MVTKVLGERELLIPVPIQDVKEYPSRGEAVIEGVDPKVKEPAPETEPPVPAVMMRS